MFIFLISLLLLAAPASAARHEAAIVTDYKGAHVSEFTLQLDRVRLLVRQAQLEVSSRLGLIQYVQGFQYPLTIFFDDGAPPGLENSLAYVVMSRAHEAFQQNLVINVDAMVKHPKDFDMVFYHEMTHAVMNDAVGGDASLRLPRWLQEGLAVYVSGEGDARVKRAAERLHKSSAARLAFDLDGRACGNAYPQYYLAVKYLLDKHSVNAVQGTVRQLIEGKSLPEAIRDTTGLTWETYKQNLYAYSVKTFQDLAVADHLSIQ